MTARRTLSRLVAAVLVANLVAAVGAVLVNWPAQFGQVGTDAGADVLTSGTAISAPLLPVTLLLAALLLMPRGGVWGWIGIGCACLAAAVVFIGGAGELVADGTADVPKAVLVTSGVVWMTIALGLVGLAAARERYRGRRGAPAH